MEISCKICTCRLSNLDTHKIRMPIDGYVYRICNTCAEHLKRFTAYEFINNGHGKRVISEECEDDENNS